MKLYLNWIYLLSTCNIFRSTFNDIRGWIFLCFSFGHATLIANYSMPSTTRMENEKNKTENFGFYWCDDSLRLPNARYTLSQSTERICVCIGNCNQIGAANANGCKYFRYRSLPLMGYKSKSEWIDLLLFRFSVYLFGNRQIVDVIIWARPAWKWII